MKKFGLALSGGGFRASLYHLGLVRFLRDAGILPQVTHITSVSGGSVLAAHLALNWGRYNGSASEFESAAAELLAFIRLDVRNRILRRYPMWLLARWPYRLIGRSARRLTRPGLLEYHYENYLYGDTSLFELPASPQLHILATNLSEGCLCSFNRTGLWIMRRQPEHSFAIEQVHTGLATVAMAVAASSAFPGFFPPLELTSTDVGANRGEFSRQAFTDGGVFDNLGVRMFRFLEASLKAEQCALDGVLVSDVGKSIENQSNQRAGGLIRTAVRASEILMDRVWQLESDTFADTPGFMFARVTDIVEPQQDPTALHPEIQRKVPNIRTDLDRFSELEISSLVRHGYCVGRKVCRSNTELFGAELPVNPPWDPIPEVHGAASVPAASRHGGPHQEPTPVTREARTLQISATRRIWSTLLDFRDWTSYVYVPIIVPLLILMPYLVVKSYQRSARLSHLVESLSQGSRDLETMRQLLEGPVSPWIGETAESVGNLDEPDFKGYEILQDSRIIDMRAWNPAVSAKNDSESLVYGYRRVKVLKKPAFSGSNLFRIGVLATHPKAQIRFPRQDLQPKLRMAYLEEKNPDQKAHWKVSADFSKVPAGEFVDLIYEHLSPGEFLRRGPASTSITFHIQVDTAEVTRWFLLPRGKEYRSFRILRWKTGRPDTVVPVKVVNEYLADDSTILAYKLISVKAGDTHEVTWYYR